MLQRLVPLALSIVVACGGGGDGGPSGATTSGAGGAIGAGGAGGTSMSAPTASFTVSRESPLVATFDGSASVDADGTIVSFRWDFGDGTTGDGAVVEHTYDSAGCYEVSLTVVDDDDLTGDVDRTTRIVEATSGTELDFGLVGLPRARALLPRGLDDNLGRAVLSGQSEAVEYESLVARVHREQELVREVEVDLCGEASLEVPVDAELASHRIEVVLRGLGNELPLGEVDDVVAGDVYLVNGQSNAVSSQYEGSADEELSPFIRSFGRRTEDVQAHSNDDAWHEAASVGQQGAIGQWPLRMAAELSRRQSLPIAIINGARGGRPIDYFARNDANRTDLDTNYGRLLDRVQRAGLVGGIRAMLWYQGESDGANASAHHDGFTTLYGHWQEDFPGMEHHYIAQIRLGCGGQVQTREVQRQLAAELERTSTMSTTGLDGHDGCHYSYLDGYRDLGDRFANLLERDLYGASRADVEAVNVSTATLMGDTIVIETTSDATALQADPGVEAFFQALGGDRAVTGITVQGTQLHLSLGPGANDPTEVAFVGHSGAGPWVLNAGRVGLLAFLIPLN